VGEVDARRAVEPMHRRRSKTKCTLSGPFFALGVRCGPCPVRKTVGKETIPMWSPASVARVQHFVCALGPFAGCFAGSWGRMARRYSTACPTALPCHRLRCCAGSRSPSCRRQTDSGSERPPVKDIHSAPVAKATTPGAPDCLARLLRAPGTRWGPEVGLGFRSSCLSVRHAAVAR
jgi:hypothetical protein